jgi:hypothetical protein
MEKDPKERGPAVEQPSEKDVEREAPPASETEHHGITGPRRAEDEVAPVGPESTEERHAGQR